MSRVCRRTLRECVDWNMPCKQLHNKFVCRTLRECVDWNHLKPFCLKTSFTSHSSWVRGLKPEVMPVEYITSSRTLRECVDWNTKCILELVMCHTVALFVSAWIETLVAKPIGFSLECRTLRECVDWNTWKHPMGKLYCVALFVSAWIETKDGLTAELINMRSHSSWVRGLKQALTDIIFPMRGRTLRECVDWNIIRIIPFTSFVVALFVSAWIETPK